MGDWADMILDGLLDEVTGEYIDGDAPGYPRSMHYPKKESYKNPHNPGKSAFKGLKNILSNSGLSNKNTRNEKAIVYVIRDYALNHPKLDHTEDIEELSIKVQKQYAQFIGWYYKSRHAKYKRDYPISD